jgi:hypothetical protein
MRNFSVEFLEELDKQRLFIKSTIFVENQKTSLATFGFIPKSHVSIKKRHRLYCSRWYIYN